MRTFTYARATSAAEAVELAAGGARYLGGGTNLVDLMREEIERPVAIVDVSGLEQGLSELPDGSILITAATRNTAVAAHPVVQARYPALARAIVSGASGQLRNMATVGGNLLQRTRCAYFYDAGSPCNKREPGSGCQALEGFNRSHAVLGTSEHCVAVHPSDMCVALTALDAVVQVLGPNGERLIPIGELHLEPGDTPHIETELEPGELITAIQLPASPTVANSTYRKVRDRASYAFALVSVAAAIQMKDDHIDDVRLAFGGLATRPWRAHEAERHLRGAVAGAAVFEDAIRAELEPARPLQHNAFKIDLAVRLGTNVLEGLLR